MGKRRVLVVVPNFSTFLHTVRGLTDERLRVTPRRFAAETPGTEYRGISMLHQMRGIRADEVAFGPNADQIPEIEEIRIYARMIEVEAKRSKGG